MNAAPWYLTEANRKLAEALDLIEQARRESPGVKGLQSPETAILKAASAVAKVRSRGGK